MRFSPKGLPWYRIITSSGAMADHSGAEEQRPRDRGVEARSAGEGVVEELEGSHAGSVAARRPAARGGAAALSRAGVLQPGRQRRGGSMPPGAHEGPESPAGAGDATRGARATPAAPGSPATPATPASTAGRVAVGLVLLAVAVRWIRWARTDALFNDGPIFLGIARLMEGGHWGVALGHDYHPLYPLVVLALRAVLAPFGGVGWETAGAAVSIAGGAASVLFLHLWLRDAFGARVALLGGLLLAVHVQAVEYSADVQSEGVYLACFTAAVWLGWRALERGRAADAAGSGA